MRTCLGISVVVHAAIMLWLVFAPGAKPFDPASAEPIQVDLLRPQDLPPEAKLEPPKSEEAKSALARPALRKSEASKPSQDANQMPALQDSAQERAATAARLAWMLNLPTDTVASLAAPPSESKSNLAGEQIAEFKAQVSKCWVTPAGVPSTPGFDVLIRIALKPDGRLGATPELIRAPASLAGPPLVESAKRALQQCQPYATLPADKYKDWKILDLTFTAEGPSGLSGPPARKGATLR
jgi:hypothetical protein